MALRNRQSVSMDVRSALNGGKRESRDLVEALVVDFAELWRALVPEAATLAGQLEPAVGSAKPLGIVGRMEKAGELLAGQPMKVIRRVASCDSDTGRGWAAYALCRGRSRDVEECLGHARQFARDGHFGVREWAWMAARPKISTELGNALRLLQPWTREGEAGVRRFATEATRPRGVWCSHIQALKDKPEIALPLLEALKADREKYVGDSLANWLNDAAKTRPDFVKEVTGRWKRQAAGQTDEAVTLRICKRATRSF
jgi:3-methyladenine DNA glycosylase AlkC